MFEEILVLVCTFFSGFLVAFLLVTYFFRSVKRNIITLEGNNALRSIDNLIIKNGRLWSHPDHDYTKQQLKLIRESVVDILTYCR